MNNDREWGCSSYRDIVMSWNEERELWEREWLDLYPCRTYRTSENRDAFSAATARTGAMASKRPIATLGAWTTIPPGATAMATPSARAMSALNQSARAVAKFRARTQSYRWRLMTLARPVRAGPRAWRIRSWNRRTAGPGAMGPVERTRKPCTRSSCLTARCSDGDRKDLSLVAPELTSGALWHDGWEESPVPLPKVENSRECAPRFEPIKVKAREEETSTPTTERLLATGPSLPSKKGKEESLEVPTCCTTSPTLHKFDLLGLSLNNGRRSFDQRKVDQEEQLPWIVLKQSLQINLPCATFSVSSENKHNNK